jgi:hypothetical protein
MFGAIATLLVTSRENQLSDFGDVDLVESLGSNLKGRNKSTCRNN